MHSAEGFASRSIRTWAFVKNIAIAVDDGPLTVAAFDVGYGTFCLIGDGGSCGCMDGGCRDDRDDSAQEYGQPTDGNMEKA